MINNLSEKERLDWIQLSRTENIGSKTFFKLLELYKTADKALEALPEMSIRGGRKKAITPFDIGKVEQEVENIANYGAEIIAFCEDKYPEPLRHISDPPPIITIFGNAELLSKESIAIVGARNASTNGCRLAHKIAGGLGSPLGKGGYVIVSGLARGIDTAAHRGSIDYGTIAVIAGGIDNIYPRENTQLYKEIAEKGVIIAESPFGNVPRADSFPRRNRIISGLSLGTVIVEATLRSGSLITTRLAMEQGREVMAIPGFPLDPRAEGPNKLLKQGATLVTSAEDIIEAVSCATPERQASLFEEDAATFTIDTEEYNQVANNENINDILLDKMGTTAISIDDLIANCNADVNAVLTSLLELEIAGRILRHPGNMVSLLV